MQHVARRGLVLTFAERLVDDVKSGLIRLLATEAACLTYSKHACFPGLFDTCSSFVADVEASITRKHLTCRDDSNSCESCLSLRPKAVECSCHELWLNKLRSWLNCSALSSLAMLWTGNRKGETLFFFMFLLSEGILVRGKETSIFSPLVGSTSPKYLGPREP